MRVRRLHLALLALQLAGQFGDRTMGLVQRALRVFTLLFGSVQLLTETGQLFFQLGLAVLQLFDLLAKLLDLAFAQQRTLLGRAGRDTRSQPWPRRSPPWVMTESPSGRRPATPSLRKGPWQHAGVPAGDGSPPDHARAASEVGATFRSSSPLATSAR